METLAKPLGLTETFSLPGSFSAGTDAAFVGQMDVAQGMILHETRASLAPHEAGGS